jgi:5'-methylthioadenosine phosphorylase
VGRLAVVGKHHTLGDPDGDARAPGFEPFGVFDHGSYVTLYRHGVDAYLPPHRIEHAAHLRLLDHLGCDRVVGLSSVGSLRRDLPVGTFVAPHDFVALDQAPLSTTHDERQHVVPGFTVAWRDRVVSAWRDVAAEPIVDRGVYWQANGPRFETPAEIRFIAPWADLIGMTVASECVAANHRGLDYAAICVVDNLANGVGDAPLTVEEFQRGEAANRARLAVALEALIPELAR